MGFGGCLLFRAFATFCIGVIKNQSGHAGDRRNADLIPGPGRSLGGGHGNPLQYSCLENPMDRGSPGESQGRGALVGCCLWGRTELDTTEAT